VTNGFPQRRYFMKYYQNKVSGEIIGVFNKREVISHPTEKSIKKGFKNFSTETVYDINFFNVMLGDGTDLYCITHSYLIRKYEELSKTDTLKLLNL
jgi:hypothetical protein